MRFWLCGLAWTGSATSSLLLARESLFRGVFGNLRRLSRLRIARFVREEGFYTGAMAINLVVSELISSLHTSFPLRREPGINPQVPLIPIMIFSTMPINFPILFFCPARGLWLSMNYFFNPSQIER